MVLEIRSAPRVAAELRRGRWTHLAPGFALDLTVNDPDDGEPWDFLLANKRGKARKLFSDQRPYLLIGSPGCLAYSTWQALNRFKSQCPEKYDRAQVEATVHMDFVASLYQ